MKTLRFVFIGCGKIAHFHADVIKYLGHRIDIVVARKYSANIDSFAKKYAIREKIYGMDSFLDYCRNFKDRFDCILVCTPWNVTENILKEILPLNIPIMSEKPAVLSIAALNNLQNNYNLRNLFVGYNRRFYDFIPTLQDLIRKESPMCVDILSADPYEMIIKRYTEKIARYVLHYYTSHLIDLMIHLLDDVKVNNIVEILRDGKNSWVCMLTATKHKCPMQIKILMDCPQNNYFRVFFEKRVAELMPLERLIIYDKLKKSGPPGKVVYSPSIKMQIETDDRFKPGFLNQTQYFIKNFVRVRNYSLEHIKQLEKVTSFCDMLIKSRGR